MCVFLVAVTDGVYETVVAVLLSIQHAILDEDGDGPQDERHKQVHVNEVPGAVELPGERRERGGQNISLLILFSLFITANPLPQLDMFSPCIPGSSRLIFTPHCSHAESQKVFMEIK